MKKNTTNKNDELQILNNNWSTLLFKCLLTNLEKYYFIKALKKRLWSHSIESLILKIENFA